MKGASAYFAVAGGLIITLLAWSASTAQTFSQYPGFTEYFAANPPREALPTAQEQALLKRHQPRIYLPAHHPGLISFYDDYIAQGELIGPDGKVLSSSVTPSLLNAHKEDPRVVFEHQPNGRGQTPVVFGRVDYSDRILETSQRFTLLTYHAVFRVSGIVAGVAWWQALALSIAGDLEDWHQLDHYTAATLVLDEAQQPVMLMLQQHNYTRTYLYGEALSRPEDGRPPVDVAIRSNELYPHESRRVRRRAVSFLDPKSFRYMIGAGKKPLMTADDITHPQHEAAYELRFLAPSDAFYTFKGTLGKRRWLPGRDGPPGADYNTLPSLKPPHRQLVAGYWRAGHRGDMTRLDEALATSDYIGAFLQVQMPIFRGNVRRAMHGHGTGAFR
ncbi:MAG: hypothetical protein ETSY2_22420 [Candidatus Entotheonella gemina]|uniref:Uncharacterized protein n=1 Tax=Candidatus Entotheonella gemina TaxID=1429439 RepID=W4M6G3_9BACT|nr:MAG: hypothetical protein ETSY2_22420 [Candidatus Entotheonella gemina]